MNSPSLLKIGGLCGSIFSLVWLICTTGYLAHVGFPSEPPTVTKSVDLMREGSYQLLFWLWPVAYLAVIPFALAVRDYLLTSSPALARLGSVFLLLYVGLWFVFRAVIMAGLALAQNDPVNEAQLGFVFTLTGTLGSPLFWAIALFEACWAAPLLGRGGLHRAAGWAFCLGSISSLVYFVMRYTGPYRLAEIVHEGLIVFMIVGVACLSVLLLRAARLGRGASEEAA